MTISFSKYQGTGNDFILVDNRRGDFPPGVDIQKLCDRRFGIGADGFILMEEKDGLYMRYYNSDGRISSMCGNGGRCFAAFARQCGIAGEEITFRAADGMHTAVFSSKDPVRVRLSMMDVATVEQNKEFTFLDTGSPHVVTFVDEVKGLDVVAEGRRIRNSERFRGEGTNVNFVRPHHGMLSVRTYERGVEDETYSCGTGVTASVLAAAAHGDLTGDKADVETPGGQLTVYYRKKGEGFTAIWLEGEATFVYKGEIKIGSN